MKQAFTAAALSLTLSLSAATPDKLGKLPSQFDYNGIETYFSGYLQGNQSPYSAPNYTMPLDRVTAVEASVWNEWKKANAAFDEERIPDDIQSLYEETPTVYSWQLPAQLEPNAVMKYYYGFKGKKGEKGFPLYVYMHGSGPKMMEWMTGLKLAQSFDDSPSAYFIPCIPNEGEYYRWWQKSKQWSWEKLFRQAMLRDDLLDPNRLYFFGISEGGYGSQRLASFYADYLAAAGPMAGGEPLINAPAENLYNTAFTFHTGAKDYGFLRNKLTSITAEALDSLHRLYPDGYTHLVELVPNMGHAIKYGVTTPWLSQHSRNPYPKHFKWENFEMDGRYRDGFYNLYIDRRSNSNESSRTYYQMDIDGNDIDLKVDLVKYSVAQDDRSFGFSIGLYFNREYTPATTGIVTIYLNDHLVDLSKKVNLTVNGKKVFSGKVQPTLANMVNSCARYYDPARVYPAAITVDISNL